MSQPKVDVLIIGNGFAGIVAANRLADAGVHAVLLDENIHIGGQLLRQVPERLGQAVRHDDYVKKTGRRFIDAVKAKKITVMNRTRVLGIYPGHEVLVEENEKKVRTLKADRLILATGGRERFLPFPGWTLPGVISGGAVQVLIKSSGVLPAREMLVAGSGLFLFSVAYESLRAGARVKAVLERTGVLDKLPLLAQLPRQLPKLTEGARFMSRILLAGVPLRFRSRVLEARGSGRLEQVGHGQGGRFRQDDRRRAKKPTTSRCWPFPTASPPTWSWRKWPAATSSSWTSAAAGWSQPARTSRPRSRTFTPPARSPASPAP